MASPLPLGKGLLRRIQTIQATSFEPLASTEQAQCGQHVDYLGKMKHVEQPSAAARLLPVGLPVLLLADSMLSWCVSALSHTETGSYLSEKWKGCC